MNVVAKFMKVSYEQFKKDWIDCFLAGITDLDMEEVEKSIKKIYDNIKLPKRSTRLSAGYDIFSPCVFEVPVGEAKKIPTGIRCFIKEDWVLGLYPRSGQGFKTGIHLANTVGIVDADYVNALNEGHIMVKLVNDSSLANHLILKSGQAFCQGVFLPYGITEDDEVTGIRNGGFGSTDRK